MIQRHWPLHLKPVEGEALSSWLGRIAAIYNLSLEDLLKYDLGYEISPYDLDLNPPITLLENIERRSNLSLNQIHHMTFRSFVPFLIDQLDPSFNIFETYILQYPVLFSVNTRPSRPLTNWRPWLSDPPIVRACPSCIKSESKTMIRLSWKLPIMLSCSLHGCRLKTCTSYSSEYVYWKEVETIDLPVTKAVLNMDARTWQALMTGKVDLPQRSIHAGVWFRLLRSLLNELSLPLSCYPAHVDRIKHIWNTCGYPVRAGLNIWKPYEYLSVTMQMMMLEAAATAIYMIEVGSINSFGEHAKLFQPEHIDNDDQQYCLESINNNNKYLSLPLGNLFDQVIAQAKVDREFARQLRALYLYGRNDPNFIKEIDSIFLELGIPFRF